MTPRLRINYAWACRWLAKAIGEHANRIDPIRLNVPIKPKPGPDYKTSRALAEEAIARAKERHYAQGR